jgi:hypothetical protein
MNSYLIEVTKTLVFSSILFVWVVRYKNIIAEFQSYSYPDWLRDLVGILKVSFAIMLMNQDTLIIKLGSVGIMVLMLAAVITHLRVKNSLPKMLPSLVLFTLCGFIFLSL